MNIGSLYLVKKWSWLLCPTKETAAAWYSKRLNCEVTYFSPDSIVVFLEEDGELKRILTSEGLVGWIWFTENYNDYFEEVSNE